MVIHSASDLRPRTTLCGDYFYNYFSRGIDILFDGQVWSFLYSMCACTLQSLQHFFCEVQPACWPVDFVSLQTHKIKKFVLHTNFPGHSDFNSYMKCNFVIYDAEGTNCSLQSVCCWWDQYELTIGFVSAEGAQQPGNTSKNCITPRTKWEQVKVWCLPRVYAAMIPI